MGAFSAKPRLSLQLSSPSASSEKALNAGSGRISDHGRISFSMLSSLCFCPSSFATNRNNLLSKYFSSRFKTWWLHLTSIFDRSFILLLFEAFYQPKLDLGPYSTFFVFPRQFSRLLIGPWSFKLLPPKKDDEYEILV